MDPTTAIPVHFTLQTIGIAAAGLLLAWTLVRKQWVGALGAAMLAAGEGLHAGRYIATDDDPALIVLRFTGIALLSIATVRVDAGRRLYIAGASLVVGGTVWGTLAGGGIADPSIGPHALLPIGYLLLAGWASLVSRDSVRLRVLTALVGMLALAVVVGGGAVSRVAALDKRNEQLRQLGSAAKAASEELVGGADGLARRAALLSPLLADDLSTPGEPTRVRTGLRTDEPEAITVVDRQGGLRAFVWSGTAEPPYGASRVAGSSVVASALRGSGADGFAVSSDELVILAAVPVYRPGAAQGAADILGAVAIAHSRSPEMLRRAAQPYAPDAEIVVVGRTTAATQQGLIGIQPLADSRTDVAFERLDTGTETRPVATTTLGDGVRLVVVGSDEGTVQAATGLLRALLVAILTAALLAVVIALWLSARVTRPILDLAASAEQVKSDFLTSLSHELRTPLTPIRGYTEILRRGRVPSRRAADYLDEIGEAAGRLERIVTLLLDVAAQEAGRFRIDAGDPRPADVLNEAAERWSHRARRHPVRVVAPRSLPRIDADPDAIARVLDELIDNAMKFSPSGGPVELRARRTKAGVELSVTDEGIGIEPEQAVEFTRAFSQVDSGDRRRFGGLGLGLAYVSGVLRAHGASLSMTSRPGVATTFSFTLRAAGMVSRMPAKTGRARQRGAGE